MLRSIFLLLIFVASTAWADNSCNELLTNRLSKLLFLDMQKAEKSVILSNEILLGKTGVWNFWRKRNPWQQYEGERVLVVTPPGNSGGTEPILSFQNIMSYESFADLVPEVRAASDDILKLSRSTKNEWGYVVYVLRDPKFNLHVITNLDKFTSNDPKAIEFRDTLTGMNEITQLAQSEVKRKGGGEAWEVLEMWFVHTHPGLYSPLSVGDVGAAENMFRTYFSKSLRFRMIAITTDDPTVFSLVHEPIGRHLRYWIHPDNGWVVSDRDGL